MDMGKTFLRVVALMALSVVAAWGQQTETASNPPAAPMSSGQAGEGSQVPTSEETPQGGQALVTMAPLSGAKELNPFNQREASYFLPAFQWHGFGDSNELSEPGQSRLQYLSMYLGSFQLQRTKKRSDLNLNYTGALLLSTQRLPPVGDTRPASNGFIHQLGFSDTVNWRRWKLLFDDDFLYLPSSPMGFSGISGVGVGGGLAGDIVSSTTGLNPALSPSQSILTGYARRVSNAAVGEAEYSATSRSTLTASVVYGNLQFLDPGYINHTYMSVIAGYNHLLTPHNQVGVSYTDTELKFSGYNQDILNRGVDFMFGHQITGRLSLTLTGGPILTQIAQPLGGTITRSFFNTFDSLKYSSPKTDLEVDFLRHLTGGSGVLLGSEGDIGRLLIGRALPHKFHISVNLDDNYNQSLTQVSVLARRTKYELWQGGINLRRKLGRRWDLFLMYNGFLQKSNIPTCIGGVCGDLTRRQIGSIGLSWEGRMIPL
jgi:hypothetical protein